MPEPEITIEQMQENLRELQFQHEEAQREIKRREDSFIFKLEIMFGKRLDESEREYVNQRVDVNYNSIESNDTSEQKERKLNILFCKLIMYLMPEGDRRTEQLEKVKD